MRVYLMQHGEARSKEEDPDRPLTEGGRNDVQRVAARMVAAGVELRRVAHSGKTRARQTAEEVASVLRTRGDSVPVQEEDRLGPTDDPEWWVDRLSDDGHGTLLVGHLPHMARLASSMVARFEDLPVVSFQNGAALCLERDESGWTVRWYVTPEVA